MKPKKKKTYFKGHFSNLSIRGEILSVRSILCGYSFLIFLIKFFSKYFSFQNTSLAEEKKRFVCVEHI